MFLRRMIDQVRSLHWTMIFIDFVIVVVGVFIGLEAQEWNQARQDRTREHFYLASIVHELDEGIGNIRYSIRLTKERMALDELLIRSQSDPGVVRADPGRFIYALTRGGYTFSPVIRDDTFEEIKSAGGLGIIRNETLAIDLMRFYSDVRGEAQWDYTRSQDQTEYVRRSAGILSDRQLKLAPSGSHTIPVDSPDDAMAAYKRMMDRPDFLNWVTWFLFDRGDNLETEKMWLDRAQALRARVAAEPGVAELLDGAKEQNR